MAPPKLPFDELLLKLQVVHVNEPSLVWTRTAVLAFERVRPVAVRLLFDVMLKIRSEPLPTMLVATAMVTAFLMVGNAPAVPWLMVPPGSVTVFGPPAVGAGAQSVNVWASLKMFCSALRSVQPFPSPLTAPPLGSAVLVTVMLAAVEAKETAKRAEAAQTMKRRRIKSMVPP